MDELAFQAAPGMAAIQVSARSVPLAPDDEMETSVGKLTYLGGLHLTSPVQRFSGFSALYVSPDGRKLLAASDRAHWMSADLVYKQGQLSGLQNVSMAPVLDEDGTPLGKPRFDLEGLTISGGDPFDPNANGSVIVSFETKDRIARYNFSKDGANAKAIPVPAPDAIKQNVSNKGIEGITLLANGQLLAITERTLDSAGNAIGWLINSDGSAQNIKLKRKDTFELTDLDVGPDGTIYTLERRFKPISGPGMRIRAIAPETIRPNAVLDGEELIELDVSYSIDNMEGLSIRETQDGRTLFYIISDDNGNSLQRTLLLMFELSD